MHGRIKPEWRIKAITIVATISVAAFLVSRWFWAVHSIPVEIPISESKQTPLDCRVVLISPDERRTEVEDYLRRQSRLTWANPQTCKNPLIATSSYLKAEITNTSGQDFAIYDQQLFYESEEIKDTDGTPICFGQLSLSSLKRWGQLLGDKETIPVVTLKPGQVVTRPVHMLGCPYGPTFKSGKYTCRAVFSYFKAPDGEDCYVESQPYIVTITERDIREYESLK